MFKNPYYTKSISLSLAVIIYLILFILTFISLSLFLESKSDNYLILFIISYIFSGLILNRVVLRRLVEWHILYNTVYHVSQAKILFFFFWPMTYIRLFFRLFIIKVL